MGQYLLSIFSSIILDHAAYGESPPLYSIEVLKPLTLDQRSPINFKV